MVEAWLAICWHMVKLWLAAPPCFLLQAMPETGPCCSWFQAARCSCRLDMPPTSFATFEVTGSFKLRLSLQSALPSCCNHLGLGHRRKSIARYPHRNDAFENVKAAAQETQRDLDRRTLMVEKRFLSAGFSRNSRDQVKWCTFYTGRLELCCRAAGFSTTWRCRCRHWQVRCHSGALQCAQT